MRYRLAFIFLLSSVTVSVQAQPPYPVVSEAEQRQRDKDRRLILETELAAERDALTKSQAMSATSPERDATVHRHTENIKALQRELDAVAGRATDREPQRVMVRAIRPAASTTAPKAPRFWDPYSRTSDTTDFSTSPRRESHE
ncbi:hypothetical protein [Herbaspirillum sp. SJZ107]|uniref:hypothetical protein n=1 Tax=Herbaspirillum sp. SJZ107 TaxID=2572881 RepID=UPI0011696521|nr:hypothetical protein [Herbaspirillum sp. SJZ107]TQK07833.1 hypothetical protein FBX97_3122 [Herbaspirillum sp. SJZ107]